MVKPWLTPKNVVLHLKQQSLMVTLQPTDSSAGYGRVLTNTTIKPHPFPVRAVQVDLRHVSMGNIHNSMPFISVVFLHCAHIYGIQPSPERRTRPDKPIILSFRDPCCEEGKCFCHLSEMEQREAEIKTPKRYTKINLRNCVTLDLDTGPQLSVMFGCFCGSLHEFGQDHLFLSQTIPRDWSTLSQLET